MQRPIYEDQSSKLYILLTQTRDALFKLRQRELGKFNLSNIESGVLAIVDVLKPEESTPVNIANYYLREQHAISKLLMRMEKKGLINRKRDLYRKNQVRVEITDNGRKALEDSKKRKAIQEILGSLSGQQCDELESILLVILSAAKKKLNVGNETIPPQ